MFRLVAACEWHIHTLNIAQHVKYSAPNFRGPINCGQFENVALPTTTLPFMASSNFKLESSITEVSRTSHLDACIFMEHAHPLSTRMIL
jgi:hypothetical protein